MFLKLSYLFNSFFLFSDYQSGRSCVRWSGVPFNPAGLQYTERLLPLRAEITGIADTADVAPVIVEKVVKLEKEPRKKRSDAAKRRYAVVKSALQQYEKMHGDMRVPYAFIIPLDDQSWPEKTRGMKLGKTVSNIRRYHSFADWVEDFVSIGFDYSTQSKAYSYASIESALLRYKEKYGDMLVLQLFVIPTDDESWPKETWGMTLGRTVNSIRSGASNKDKKEELTSLGFDYSSQSIAHGYVLVKLALLRYCQKRGDMLVERSFIIPTDDESWPEETWGMKLGTTVALIRSGLSYKDKKEDLISIGFDYSSQSVVHSYALVETALKQYQLDYGDMLVERSFIVPTDDKLWPEATWGMKLGFVVHNIRSGHSHKDRRKELTRIGFDYSSQKAREGIQL